MLCLSHLLLLLALVLDSVLGKNPGLFGLVVVHLLQVGHIPELDSVIMADAGNDLPAAAHIHPLHRQLLLMVTHDTKKAVRIQVDSSDVAILASSHHNVVSDAQHAVDAVWMAWELITVQPILVLTKMDKM